MRTSESLPLGTLLRRFRTEAALTQEALAERAGVSVRAVSDLERGIHQVPRFETLGLLADALRLEPAARAAFLAASRPDTMTATAASSRLSPLAAMPRPLPRFVGRKREIDALCHLIETGSHRLVTLTGPGGVGKTRLALAVANAVAGSFTDGVAFVDLTAIRDPALVPAAVATALGVREVGASTLIDQLHDYLRPRAMLLLLDNFEQVLAAALFVAGWLGIAPGLRVVVTSRAPLQISGEQVAPVGPLALPAPGDAIILDGTQLPEAVALFLARAQAADSAFALTGGNVAAVADLVRRLDGLPLAIELAAAHARSLPPSALLDRLARQPLHLLSGGPRDQPPRQRTIRDAIAWSYHLLPPNDQRLFRRLSVFVGGFTLASADAVAELSLTEERDSLDGIAALIDASMVRRISGDGETLRFTMLETIREFGLEQLAACGEERAVRDAHASWVVRLADEAERALLGSDQRRWLTNLDAELPNMRAALGWLEQTGTTETLLRVMTASIWFWYIRGHLTEGRGWLERSLSGTPVVSPVIQAGALFAAGALAFGQANYGVSLLHAEASMVSAERAVDPRSVALARFLLGMSPQIQGDYPLGVERLEQTLTLWREIDDPAWIGMTLTQLADAYFGLGNLNRAAALHEEAVDILRRIGMPWALAVVLACFGSVLLELGETSRAQSLLLESLAVGQDIDDQRSVGETLTTLAIAAERARNFLYAAHLVGAIDSVRGRIRAPLALIPVQVARYEHSVAVVRAHLGDDAFAAAYATGRTLSLPDAIHLVRTMRTTGDDDDRD